MKSKNDSNFTQPVSKDTFLALFTVNTPVRYSGNACAGTPFRSVDFSVSVSDNEAQIPLPRAIFEDFVRAAEHLINVVPGKVSCTFSFSADTPTLEERMRLSDKK